MRASSGHAPTIVHVGANRLSGHDEQAKYAMYKAWSPRIILAEPNPLLHASLYTQVGAMGINESGAVRVVEAAVCEADSEDAAFYIPSAEVMAAPPQMEFGALSEAQIGTFNHTVFGVGDGLSQFLEQIHVRCYTAGTFLGREQIAPAAVDVLMIDTEGHDAVVLKQFLGMADLKPALIEFEWTLLGRDDLDMLLDLLFQRGYTLYAETADIYALPIGL